MMLQVTRVLYHIHVRVVYKYPQRNLVAYGTKSVFRDNDAVH